MYPFRQTFSFLVFTPDHCPLNVRSGQEVFPYFLRYVLSHHKIDSNTRRPYNMLRDLVAVDHWNTTLRTKSMGRKTSFTDRLPHTHYGFCHAQSRIKKASLILFIRRIEVGYVKAIIGGQTTLVSSRFRQA